MTALISGHADPRFAAVQDAFAANIESGQDRGAAVAVAVNGEIVVDLKGGFSDKAKETPWSDETLVCVYSTGKAVLSILIARAVEAGLIDYAAPVAAYWPEFAAEGKGEITVAQALSHQAGLPGFTEEIDPRLWLNWDALCAHLAATKPMWEPGTASGYHPQTVGFIGGELLRRTDGRSVGRILREDFTEPHGISVFCGLTDVEMARAAYMAKPKRAPDLGEMNAYKRAAFLLPWSSPGKASRQEWAAAEIPAANMHADAPSLARMLSIVATGGWFGETRMLSAQTVEALSVERVRGNDLVLPFDLSFGAGLMRNTGNVYGPNPETLGHSGFGGSCAFADPDARLSFAYVTGEMSEHLRGDPRAGALLDALYGAL